VHFTTSFAQPRGEYGSSLRRGRSVYRQQSLKRSCQVPMTLDSYNDPVIFYNATVIHLVNLTSLNVSDLSLT